LFIPEPTYKTIIDNSVNVCVDVCLRYENRYLLIKRNEEPMKNIYWPIGGRISKGEKAEEAARRKIKEEIGIDFTEELRPIGYYEDTYDVSSFGKMSYSTISIVWFGYLSKEQVENIQLDYTSDSYDFQSFLPERFKVRTYEDYGRPYWYLASTKAI